MADWKSFTIQVPGKDFMEPVRDVLESLLIYLEVLKAILETIKLFLVDFGNPIRALVEALIKLIEELFLALKQSGFFMYLDVPNPIDDPNFDWTRGGYPAFVNRFKASLFDSKDFNRPQPRGSNKGGFVLLMVDATTPWQLIQAVARLLSFFGKGFERPQYLAPNNFKVLPVGADGDPILAAANVFTSGPIESIQLQWTPPTTQESPDSGFEDVIQKVYRELVPPSFLIGRSTINPASRRIDISDLGTPEAVGIVEFDRETEIRASNGQRATRREVLRDDSGEPVIKFESYLVAPIGTRLLGAAGKYRFLDNNVVTDEDYYYQVRAFIGSLDYNEETGQINFPTSVDALQISKHGNNTSIPVMPWPATSSNLADVVSMGLPTLTLKTRIPVDVGDFDVIENLTALFEVAFSLDFHEELPVDEEGRSIYSFDQDGLPLGTETPNSAIGKGSLTSVSGILAGLPSLPILNLLQDLEALGKSYQPDEISGTYPDMPWTTFNVQRRAAQLADAVGTAMLQAGTVSAFRDIMRSLPRGQIDVIHLSDLDTLEEVVFRATESEDYVIPGSFLDVETRATFESVKVYVEGYADVTYRLSILDVINFIKSFTLGGVPPDWISVAPLRDIIPWSGSFLYDLLDKIQALLDAFNGVIQEIRDFIDLVIRKIEVLEEFIEFLISLLDFIESLEIGAFVLNSGDVEGTATAWVNVLDTAGGTLPATGAAGYSAGVGLAYVAPDVEAFREAFDIIFGS
jgi:hypothetical protein